MIFQRQNQGRPQERITTEVSLRYTWTVERESATVGADVGNRFPHQLCLIRTARDLGKHVVATENHGPGLMNPDMDMEGNIQKDGDSLVHGGGAN